MLSRIVVSLQRESQQTMAMLELLCGCRCMHHNGGDIRKWCREAQRLLRATAGCDPLDPFDVAWNAYRDHYNADANPPVSQLVNHQWVPLEETGGCQ